MTVIVHRWQTGAGRWAGGATMTASTIGELHEMADAIGLKRGWFHSDPKFPHYDLTNRNRKDAIAAGAIEIVDSGQSGDAFLAGRPADGRGPLLTDPGVTAMLPGMGPAPGDRYINKHVTVYAVVVAVTQRRYCWVTVRSQGHEYEFRLDEFEHFWERV